MTEVQPEWAIRVRPSGDPYATFLASWHGPLPKGMEDLEGQEIHGGSPFDAVSDLLNWLKGNIDFRFGQEMLAALQAPEPHPEFESMATAEVYEGDGRTVTHSISRELFERFLESAREQGWVD